MLGIFGQVLHEFELLPAHHSRLVIYGVPRLHKVLTAIPLPHVPWLAIVLEFLGDVMHQLQKPGLAVRLQAARVGVAIAPNLLHGIAVKAPIHDDVMMDAPILPLLDDRYPLGIGKPHLFAPIVDPADEVAEKPLGFFLVPRHMLIIIRQAEVQIVLPEIAVNQCLKVANCPLVVQLSLFRS